MKVLQINNCHYRRGGADIVYLNTGKLLEDNGHEVYYFSQKNSKNSDSITSGYFIEETNYFGKSLGGKIFSIPRFFYSIEARNKISQLINDLKPDIAHVHLYKASLTPSILQSLKKHNVPVIITLHDYGLICPHNSMLDGKMNICNRCVPGSALNCIIHKCNRNNLILSSISSFEYIFQKTFFPFEKYFSTIIAVSKFGQNLHQKSGKFLHLVDHLYNFYPNLKTTIPDNQKGSYFLYYGRLSEEKGVKTLLSAWVRRERNTTLKIAGTGELIEDMKKIAGENPKIQFLGFKTGKELNTLIKKSSFVIVPSEWYENNPLTIIEAYANGKPIIGADIAGIPEIIDDGNTGYLFEMKSAKSLSEALDRAEATDATEYSRLSKNARNFAEEHFSEETHYKALINIYNKLI